MNKFASRILKRWKAPARLPRQIVSGILVVCFLLPAGSAFGQESAPQPSDEVKKLQEEIDLLKKRIEKAEAEKKLSDLTAKEDAKEQELDEQIELTNKRASKAEAEKKLLKAYLPSSQVTPLEGSVSADDKATAETEWMARTVLGEVAHRVGRSVGSLSPSHVIVYNKPDILAFEKYETVKNQLDSTKQLYENALATDSDNELGPASFLMAPELASTVLKSAIDVVALFRTDTTIKGLTFEVDDSAVVARVVKGLKSSGVNAPVYLPAAFPIIHRPGARDRAQSDILTSVSGLYEQKEQAAAVVARCEQAQPPAPGNPEVGKLEGEIEVLKKRIEKAQAEKVLFELTGQKPGPAPVAPPVGAAGPQSPAANPPAARRAPCSPAQKLKLPMLKALNQQADKFLTELTKVDENSGNSALASLMRAESMKKAMPDDNSYVLHIKAKAAGNNITKRNLWTGTKRRHSAVVTVTYLVYRRDGSVADGDDITGRMGPTKFESSPEIVISGGESGQRQPVAASAGGNR